MITKQAPNMVSLSRIGFGWWVLTATLVDNDWRSAFLWLLIGLSTDYLDGWLAVKLNAITDFGKRWVDPICDFVFCLQVEIAYVFQDDQWANRLWWAIPMPLIALGLKFLKEQKRGSSIGNLAYGITPGYYLVCVIIFAYLFAQKALTSSEMRYVNCAYLPAIIIAGYFKRHRLADWSQALHAWWKRYNPDVD